MKALFQHTLIRFGHLSDETITKLLDGELSSMREFRASAHLGKCWQCKARREILERAAFQVVEYRMYQLERRLPLNPLRREAFLVRLDEVLEETATASWWSRTFSQLRSFSIPQMNPVFASTFVIVAATVLLVFIWQLFAVITIPQSHTAFRWDGAALRNSLGNEQLEWQCCQDKCPSVANQQLGTI